MVGATRLHRRGEGLEHRPFRLGRARVPGRRERPVGAVRGGARGGCSVRHGCPHRRKQPGNPPLPPILPRDHRWDRLHRLCARRFLGAHVGARLAINREELAISKRTFGRRHLQRRQDERKEAMVKKKATFAAGCFWGVEAEFRVDPRGGGNRLGTRAGTHRCNVRGGSARDPALALQYLSGPLQLASLPGVGSDAATTDSPVSPPMAPRASPLHAGRAASPLAPRRCLGGDDSGLHELDIRCGAEPRALKAIRKLPATSPCRSRGRG